MKQPPILSVVERRAPVTGGVRAQPFDACHVGVVLRAVLFVEAVVAVGAMFGAQSMFDGIVRIGIVTGGALPATLAWLLAACAFKIPLGRVKPAARYAAGALLGALAGLFACAVLAFTVLTDNPAGAPWTASAFAGALMALLMVAALVLRARGRTPAAVTARMAELQARIRPHFLFNTLNSAIALVRAEPARAEALLEDLSDLFRHALLDHGEATTLAEEIALAQRYLAIEQVRFGDRLQVQWSLDPAAAGARLPPLLLQPLVENAVIHGVEPCLQPRPVRIVTQRQGSLATIEIFNGLPPASPPETIRALRPEAAQASPFSRGSSSGGHGIALANVRARLGLLHDVQGDFDAGPHAGGWRVRIRIPA